MSTCVSCSAYYRLNAYHTDLYNCQDCTGILPDSFLDEDYDPDISALLNPSGKILAVYNEADENEIN